MLKNPKKVSDIDPSSIVGIFAAGQLLFAPSSQPSKAWWHTAGHGPFPPAGGHGAAVDFPHNKVLSALVSKLYADGKAQPMW